jgi:hypothetical protein
MRLAWTICFALTASCGDDDDDDHADGDADADSDGDSDADSDADADVDECATDLGSGEEPIFDFPRGLFKVGLYSTFASLQGRIADGDRVDFHDEAAREGACRLLTYEPVLCDPECSPTAVCDHGTCVELSNGTSAGPITIEGIVDPAPVVQPNEFADYYWDTGKTGGLDVTEVSISAAGDVIGAFELSVCGIDAPEPSTDWASVLEARAAGEDATLEWTNPVSGSRIYMRMTTGIGTHGGISPVEVECEGPDTGSLTIRGAYLDALYEEGWSCGECGDNRLTRYRADVTTVDGVEIQLRSQSEQTFFFRP